MPATAPSVESMNLRSVNRKTKTTMAAGAAALLAGGIAGPAIAGSGDDDETDHPIPATALDQASEAALTQTGGGTVTETEVNDEESKYEVEVTLSDGSQVDVQLDEEFRVVGTEDEHTDGAPGADAD